MATPKLSPDVAVYEGLTSLLQAGELPPGTKLAEVELAQAFNVSRERVRRVLLRLAGERLVELVPNRGAFVPTTSLSSVREAFDARRIIEGGLAMFLARRLSELELATLAADVAAEQRPATSKGKAEVPEDFHLQLAALSGNAHVEQVLRELLSRTSMLSPRGSGAAPLCGHREHGFIVAALKERNGAQAAELLTTHLSTMETRLRPPDEAAAVQVSVASLVKQRMRERRVPAAKTTTGSRNAAAKRS